MEKGVSRTEDGEEGPRPVSKEDEEHVFATDLETGDTEDAGPGHAEQEELKDDRGDAEHDGDEGNRVGDAGVVELESGEEESEGDGHGRFFEDEEAEKEEADEAGAVVQGINCFPR
jgi:hypothetical protein